MSAPAGRTMFEKIWSRHVVTEGPGGQTLLYVDRHLLHEGSTHALGRLARSSRRPRRPEAMFATADHYVPTDNRRAPIPDPEIRAMVAALERHAQEFGIGCFGPDDPRQGIVHVIGPEQGLTQPGITLVCGDSHTATHGAFAALAFGIGSSEVEHVMATQCLWQRRPRVVRVSVSGARPFGVSAKDVILTIIARIGAGGGSGSAIEYAGSAIAAMSMDERMTVCNMSIEAGARAGMVAPDETTEVEAFTTLTAVAAPIDLANVDTDRIIPARFLRQPRGPGFERFLFHDVRFDDPGAERPEFILNQSAYRAARILVAAENFACGSSREAAVWVLVAHGFRAFIASSFGDIFAQNCGKNGALAIRLPRDAAARLRAQLHERPGSPMTVDLPSQTVTGPDGQKYEFEVDGFVKECLLRGQDEIALTLGYGDAIAAFEERQRREMPWLSS